MKRLFVFAFAVGFALGQQTLSMPDWLASYPGATAQTRSSANLLESIYSTTARPDDVIGHYRRLFETAGLAFRPNFDGAGTAIRGSAAECDLLLAIREQNGGTLVRVSCAARHPVAAVGLAPANRPATSSIEDRMAQMRENERKTLEEAQAEARRLIGS